MILFSLQSCSNTVIGEKLENSFGVTDELKNLENASNKKNKLNEMKEIKFNVPLKENSSIKNTIKFLNKK